MKDRRYYICLTILFIILGFIVYCFTTNANEEKWTSKYIKVIATGYCTCKLCCGSKSCGRTAKGRDAKEAGIAVDPKVIPFGSRIDCKEYYRKDSWCIADDSGKAIKGNKIDLRFKTHKEAKEFGKQEIQIRVWTKE